MRVPTETEWGNYEADLDHEHAHKMFGGRTNQEMMPYFRRNVIERTDGLRWMLPIPFCYYMLGFRDFVMDGKFDDTWVSDAASCFLDLILEKLEKQPEYVKPIMQELLPAARHVARNQSSFGATEAIYGNFLEKLERIESAFETWSS